MPYVDIWSEIRRRHGEYLLQALNPTDLAYPLFNAKLISDSTQGILMHAMLQKQQKNHELLTALQPTGKRGFREFCNILRQCNCWGVLEVLGDDFDVGGNESAPTSSAGITSLSMSTERHSEACTQDEPESTLQSRLSAEGIDLAAMSDHLRLFPLIGRLKSLGILEQTEVDQFLDQRQRNSDIRVPLHFLVEIVEKKGAVQQAAFVSELLHTQRESCQHHTAVQESTFGKVPVQPEEDRERDFTWNESSRRYHGLMMEERGVL